MKTLLPLIWLTSVCALWAAPGRSLLNSDPDVIYMKNHTDEKIFLLVVKPATIYSTKKGGRKLGKFPANTKVELLAITDKAYRVKGKAGRYGAAGWVSPKLLAAKEKDFIAKFKQFYERQIMVNQLIANQDVAIGMTLGEVRQSMGEPTESELRQTKEGEDGKWDYVVTEEKKHYRRVYNPHTGLTYRQLSHVTIEEKSRVTVEFDKGLVTAVTRKRNNGPGKTHIIPAPVVCWW